MRAKTNISERSRSAIDCPVCKSKKVKIFVSSCRENLNLTGRSYDYISCLDCHVLSQAPFPSREILGYYYQLIDQSQQRRWMSPQGKAFLAKIKRLHRKNASQFFSLMRKLTIAGEEQYPYWQWLNRGSIVDLGAGSAGFCIEARNRGWRVQGIEQSRVSIELAYQLGFDLIEADLESDQAKRLVAHADNIVLNHVFEHVVDPGAFLRSLRANMKMGSKLIVLIPNPNSVWRIVFGRRWYGWDPPVHVHHYSALALKLIMQRNGFDIVHIKSIRRHDSLSAALSSIGIHVGFMRFVLRVLMVPLMPVFSLIGVGPELMCVVQVDPDPCLVRS